MTQTQVSQISANNVISILQDNWPTFRDNIGLSLGIPALLIYVPLLVVGLPAGIVAFFVAGAAAMVNKSGVFFAMIPVILISSILFAVVYNAIRVGWTKITLTLAQGNSASFADMKTAMPWFLNFLIVNFVIGIATTIGTILFIVPGILIAVRCAFAPILVIDENLTPIEALKRSNELVTGCSWQIFLYYLAYGVANTIGGFIPIVSIVAPIAVMGYFDVALAKLYYHRK